MALRFNAGLCAIGLIGLAYVYSQVDRMMNYTQAEAFLTTVKYDCFIKSRKEKIVKKDTNAMAYMDCAEAAQVAEHFGHKKSDIKKRATLAFNYTSPVDHMTHHGEHTKEDVDPQTFAFKEGQTIQIYAHTANAGKYRWN